MSEAEEAETTEPPGPTRARSEPEREPITPEEIEATLSVEPLPEPFWPEPLDGSYSPPSPPDANFQYAMRTAVPRVVDVTSVLEAERGARIASATVAATGDEIEVVLPANYSCTAPGSVEAGARYVLLTDHVPDSEGRYVLYLGAGAEHSIMRVDEAGLVHTGFGSQDAAELAEAFGGAS